MMQWITSVASFMLEVTKLMPVKKAEEPTKTEEVKPLVEKIVPGKGRDNWIIKQKVLPIILFHHYNLCSPPTCVSHC